ncbi:MAG: pyridoxal-phosphate dependent enzyme [Acidobacteriota bacterium]
MIDRSAPGVWRYRSQIRLPPDWPALSLGEGDAPWLRLRSGPWVACAQLEPTFSFKARGAAVLIAWARHALLPPLIEDSSGNAGAAMAAYAAAAGIPCRIYVPAAAPVAKRHQLAVMGAELVPVAGPRPRATVAAQQDAEGSYCSHAWNPLFIEGIKTLAFEWWEQQRGWLPHRIWVPAGQGSLVLGLSHGFGELRQVLAGRQTPAIMAVQHHSLAPLRGNGMEGPNRGDVSGGTMKRSRDEGGAPTLADGIAIPDPVRKRAVQQAVRESGGKVLTVDDEAIHKALAELADNGFWVEPTAAVGMAAHRQFAGGDDDLVVLTGHGLKSAL